MKFGVDLQKNGDKGKHARAKTLWFRISFTWLEIKEFFRGLLHREKD